MKYKSAQQLNKPRGWIYGARWSRVPCEARVVKVVIGISPSSWWCAEMTGQEISAIEIKIDGRTVYIDNSDGRALKAMVQGIAPLPGFRFVPVYKLVNDETIPVFYKAKVV